MTARDDILQAVRDWAKAAVAGGLTDDQVIPADDVGTKPPAPFLQVRVSVADGDVNATDDTRFADDLAGGVEWRMKGVREAIVDIEAFDQPQTSTAAGWLTDMKAFRQHPAVQAVLDAAGLSVTNIGQALNVSALLDSSIEVRTLRTVTVRYALTDSRDAGVPEATDFVSTITLERYESHPDPLIITIDA